MTAQPVEAVFFWPVRNITTFRSIYGRLGSGGYTKDFLQCPKAQQEALDAALGRTTQSMQIEYHWPGGSEPNGTWREAAGGERGQLAWPHNRPPAPWRIGNPEVDETVTIAGDPDRTNPAQADNVYDAILHAGTKPWLVGVKLRNDTNILHVRVYLEDAPPGLEDRSITLLPAAVRDEMLKLPASQGGGWYNARQSAPPRAHRIVAQIQTALDRGPNVLLVGPPGTGKTVALEDMRSLYRSEIAFDPSEWSGAWTDEDESGARKAVSLVFHPSYAYENFVAGLVPDAGDQGGFRLRARPGPLLSMAHWASSGGREGLIIIDEFNRGAAAAVFGDMIALLDKEKRRSITAAGATIERPYPSDSMDVPGGYASPGGATMVEAMVSLPLSLKIVAAMNSSDRSVAPLDAALRRRFEIIEVGPDYEALAGRLGLPDATPARHDPAQPWEPADVKALALRLLRRLNERIGFVLGNDFLLGQALFWDLAGDDAPSLALALAERVDERVIPMLRLTFVDQDDALASVLDIPQGGSTAIGRWEQPPAGLAAVAQARLRLNRISSLASTDEQLSALSSLDPP